MVFPIQTTVALQTTLRVSASTLLAPPNRSTAMTKVTSSKSLSNKLRDRECLWKSTAHPRPDFSCPLPTSRTSLKFAMSKCLQSSKLLKIPLSTLNRTSRLKATLKRKKQPKSRSLKLLTRKSEWRKRDRVADSSSKRDLKTCSHWAPENYCIHVHFETPIKSEIKSSRLNHASRSYNI